MNAHTIISLKTAGWLYRLAGTLGRLADILLSIFIIYGLLAIVILVSTSAIPIVSILLHENGFPHPENLPEGIYVDFSKASLNAFINYMAIFPVLLILWLRDKLLFPLRTMAGMLFALTLSMLALWWISDTLTAIRSGTGAVWSMIAASNRQADVLFGSLKSTVPSGASNIGLNVLYIAHNTILLSSLAALVALAASMFARTATRASAATQTIRISSGRIPSSFRVFFQTIAEIFLRRKAIFTSSLLALAVAAVLGALLILNAHVPLPFLEQYAISAKAWIHSSGLVTMPYATDYPLNLLNVYPITAALGLMVFIVGIGLCSRQRRTLLVMAYFMATAGIFFLLIRLPEAAQFLVFVLHAIPVAMIAVSPMIIWSLRRLIYMVKISIVGAVKSLHEDEDGFALLLRPFALDNLSVTNRFRTGGRFRWFVGLKERLEESIASTIYNYAPLYAVGSPTEKHPALGAMRHYFQDDGWMQYVDKSITQAEFIVFIIDKSQFTIWETDQIISHDAVEKVLFVLPPRKSAAVAYFDSNPDLSEQLGLTAPLVELIVKKGVLLIRSDGRGSFIGYSCVGSLPLDYTLSIDCALGR